MVWAIVLGAYLYVHNKLFSISSDFVYGITIWIPTFCIFSFMSFKIFPSNKNTKCTACERNVDFLLILSTILVPLVVFKAIQHAYLMGSPEGIMYAIREQAITPEENQLGIMNNFIYVVNVLLMVEFGRDKLVRWRTILVSMLAVLFFMATMAKLTLFTYLFSVFYILYSRGKISLKPIIWGALLLLSSVPIMYMLRGADDVDADSIIDLFMIYSVASFPAFDYIVPNSAQSWGLNTFGFIYNFFHQMGFLVPQIDSFQQFVFVPVPTNVYTVICPFYQDFGLSGIFYFAIIEGVVVGFIYKLAKTGNNIFNYLYSYVFTLLVLQFFDEMFFRNINLIMRIVILIYFCHIKFTFKKVVI